MGSSRYSVADSYLFSVSLFNDTCTRTHSANSSCRAVRVIAVVAQSLTSASLSWRFTPHGLGASSCPPLPPPRSPSAHPSLKQFRHYAGRRREFHFGHSPHIASLRSGRFIGASCVLRLGRTSVCFGLLSHLGSFSDRRYRLDGGFEACSNAITISQVPLRQERHLVPDTG